MTTRKKRPTVAGSGAHQGTGGGIDVGWHSNSDSPRDEKRKERRVYRFACTLKADREDRQPENFIPEIGDFAEATGMDHMEVLQMVKHAWPTIHDDHTIYATLDGWQRDLVPEVGADWCRHGRYANALRIFARLQRNANPEPFYLSGPMLAELIDATPRTAYRFLSGALDDGVLVMAEESRPGRCRRWHMPWACVQTSTMPSHDSRDSTGSTDSMDSEHSRDREDSRHSASSPRRDDSEYSGPSAYSEPSAHSSPSVPSVTCPRCDGEGCRYCGGAGKRPGAGT